MFAVVLASGLAFQLPALAAEGPTLAGPPVLVWEVHQNPEKYGDRAFGIATASDSEIYVAGEWHLSSPSQTNWRVVRLDAGGNQVWDWNLSLGGTDGASDVATVPGGGVVLVGNDQTAGTWRAIAVDANGIEGWQWSENPGPGNDYVRSVATDAAGNVYAAGGVDFEGPGQMMRVVKLDPGGRQVWAWNSSGHWASANSITLDDAGNIYAAGYEVVSGDYRWIVAKLTSAGMEDWVWSFNPAQGQDEAFDIAYANGTVYVGGSKWEPGPNEDTGWLVYALRTDKSIAWNYGDNPSPYQDKVTTLTFSKTGGLVLAGFHTNQTTSLPQWRMVGIVGAGTKSWEWTPSSADRSEAYDSVTLPNGDIVIAGSRDPAGDPGWHVARFALGPPPPPALDRVEISPTTASLLVGAKQQFTSRAWDQYGNPFPVTTTAWSVLGGIGSVDLNGLFTAGTVGGGKVRVEAASNGSTRAAEAVVDVLGPSKLSSVVIDPATATIHINRQLGFGATAFDQNGLPMAGASFAWSVVGSIGTINQTGLFTSASAGQGKVGVVASHNGTSVSGESSVTVTASPPVVLASAPADGATQVPAGAWIQIHWSEAMERPSAEAAFSIQPKIACAFSWPSADELKCVPDASLASGTSYCIRVAASARDLEGEPMPGSFSSCFTTSGPPAPPSVTFTLPEDGALEVSPLAVIEIGFSRPMDPASTEGAISAAPGIAGAFSWSPLAERLSWAPASPLAVGQQYAVTVATSALSSDGTPLSSKYTFSFIISAGIPGEPARVELDPPAADIGLGESVVMTYRITDYRGTEVPADVTWGVAPSGLVETVSGPGRRFVLKGIAEGSVVLTVTAEGQVSTAIGTAEIRVRNGPVGGPPSGDLGSIGGVPVIGLILLLVALAAAVVGILVWRRRRHPGEPKFDPWSGISTSSTVVAVPTTQPPEGPVRTPPRSKPRNEARREAAKLAVVKRNIERDES